MFLPLLEKATDIYIYIQLYSSQCPKNRMYRKMMYSEAIFPNVVNGDVFLLPTNKTEKGFKILCFIYFITH